MATGYTCIMHYHTTIEETSITIMAEINKKTKEEDKVKFIKNGCRAKVLLKTNNILCGEKFEASATLGRFTLRDEGRTIAIGKVLKYKLSK
jgi:peptide chain release factor subunit 3